MIATMVTLAWLAACSGGVAAKSPSAAGKSAAATAPESAAGTSPDVLRDAEVKLERQAVDGGHSPATPLTLAFRASGAVGYLWPTRSGDLCEGVYGRIGSRIECVAAENLPKVASPVMDPLFGPTFATDKTWISVFLVDLQEVRTISCGDISFVPTKVASVPIAGGLRTYYLLTTPWAPYGTLHAQLIRADAPATDRMTMVTPLMAGVRDDPRFKSCG